MTLLYLSSVKAIFNVVRELRKSRGMTSTELAQAAGLSVTTVFRIETDRASNIASSTVMRLYRALETVARLNDDEWAQFRDEYRLADSVRLPPAAALPPLSHPGAASSPAVQLATFLRSLDPTRAAAMQLVFELIDRVGAEKVVEHLEAMKRMLTVTPAPGTLIHRRETIQDGYRVTELSPHQVEQTAKDANAKPKAKKIGG